MYDYPDHEQDSLMDYDRQGLLKGDQSVGNWVVGGTFLGLAAAALQLLSRLAINKSRRRIGQDGIVGRSWKTKDTKMHQFRENYLEHWDRAPLVVPDQDIHFHYVPHSKRELSYTGKYDLNRLNTDYFTTTLSPWESLMIRSEPLPSTFVENMVSPFREQQELSIELRHTLSNNSEDEEKSENKLDEAQDNLERTTQKNHYEQAINSYVGYILYLIT